MSKDTPPRLILEIDVGKLLTVVIAHGEARFLFFDVHGGGKRRGIRAEKKRLRSPASLGR